MVEYEVREHVNLVKVSGGRVPNSPTGQVLEARPDFSVQVDVNDWSQTSLYKRLHSHVISLTFRSERKLILVNLFSLPRI